MALIQRSMNNIYGLVSKLDYIANLDDSELSRISAIERRTFQSSGNAPNIGDETYFTFSDQYGKPLNNSQIVSFINLYQNDWAGKNLLYSTSRTNEVFPSSPQHLTTDNGSYVLSGYAAEFVASSTLSPDGTTYLSHFKQNVNTAIPKFDIANLPVGTNSFAFNCYAAELNTVYIWFNNSTDGTSMYGIVDLSNGTVSYSGTSRSSFKVNTVPVPNNGYRITTSCQCTAIDTLSIGLNQNTTITGDNTSGVYFWGAQLEYGTTTPGILIPTTTTAVTLTDYSRSGSLVILSQKLRYSLGYSLLWNGTYSDISGTQHTATDEYVFSTGASGGDMWYNITAGTFNICREYPVGSGTYSWEPLIYHDNDTIDGGSW